MGDDNVVPLRRPLTDAEAHEMFNAVKVAMVDRGVVQYMIHPALRPQLDEWLVDQGLRIDPLPMEDHGTLPTFLITPVTPPEGSL